MRGILYRVIENERWIFSTLRAECCHIFTSLYKVTFRRREWYLNHSIWLGNDYMPISGYGHFNFARLWLPMSDRIMSGMAFIVLLCNAHWWNKRNTVQHELPKHYKGHSRHKYSLIRQIHFWRNGHRINITSSNLMILCHSLLRKILYTVT